MTIEVAHTLEVMVDVYGRSPRGGASSDRFAAYVAAAKSGLPVQGYNPMTSLPVLDTIDALLKLGAEDRLRTVANEAASELRYDSDDVMHLTIAAPGMWTDRLATNVEHRFFGNDPGGVLWWVDEPVSADALDAEIAAQTVRLIVQRLAGSPRTLADAVRQEGLAGSRSGNQGRRDDTAADVLDILAEDDTLATKVAFLHGDHAAVDMGFTPLGLDGRRGLDHAIAVAAENPEPLDFE